MLTGILGPILFGISNELPFMVFGGTVIMWAILLWVVMYQHAATITHNSGFYDEEKVNVNSVGSPIDVFKPVMRTPWHILERNYYSRNKSKVDGQLGKLDLRHDVAFLEQRIRKLAATLGSERDKREKLVVTLRSECKKREELGMQVKDLEARFLLLGA